MKDADPSAVHWEWFLWPKRRKVAFSVVASESSGGGSHFLGDISDSFTVIEHSTHHHDDNACQEKG